MAILKIDDVTKDFKGLRALDSVNFEVHNNEIVGLVGPNGSGKTTLINIISGFLQPTEGNIVFKGETIAGLRPHEIVHRGIARTFQLTSLFPSLTVEENLIIGRHRMINSSTLGSFFQTRSYREEEREARQKAKEILNFMGMEKQKDMVAKNLPFGDQRSAEIAIALATEPELLLVDEPAAGMNLDEQNKLVGLLQRIRQIGITMLIVEHKMKVVMGVCSSIVVLNYGVKIARGTPEEIAHDDEVIRVYLGR
jgi:branched-chain amino acid transport system ATP-binding protein